MAISTMARSSARTGGARLSGALLWSGQVSLALLFVFAGYMKLVMPIEVMQDPIAFPELFLRFIGVAELLGGLGLVLPWATGVRRALTPLAAAGLVIVMVGAVVTSLYGGAGAMALFPAVVGLIAAAVGRARATQLGY